MKGVKFYGSLKKPEKIQNIPRDASLEYSGELFRVYRWSQKKYSGVVKDFEKVVMNDSVKFIPVTKIGKIIVAEQKQPGRKKFLGILGGRRENNESIQSALLRELAEETGITPKTVKVLGISKPFVKIDWYQYYFLIYDFETPRVYTADEGEKIKLIYLSVEEFYQYVIDDKIDDLYIKSTVLKLYLEGGMKNVRNALLKI